MKAATSANLAINSLKVKTNDNTFPETPHRVHVKAPTYVTADDWIRFFAQVTYRFIVFHSR